MDDPGDPTPSRRRWLGVTVGGLVLLAAVWGVKVWQLRESVDRLATYWAIPRGQEGGLLYVALGDSTAQGVGAGRPELGYVSLLAERLRQTTGRPVQVVNLSDSGARIRDVVTRQLPHMDGLCPDVITVGVGGNDVRHYDPATFAADVEALVTGLPEGTVVADLPWFMHGRWQRDVEEGNRLLHARATAAGLVVAPLEAAMQRRGWRSMATDYAADWFHPNARGHRVWADAFWQAMRSHPTVAAPDC